MDFMELQFKFSTEVNWSNSHVLKNLESVHYLPIMWLLNTEKKPTKFHDSKKEWFYCFVMVLLSYKPSLNWCLILCMKYFYCCDIKHFDNIFNTFNIATLLVTLYDYMWYWYFTVKPAVLLNLLAKLYKFLPYETFCVCLE